ncbi:MAG: hypothetical protein ATN35_12050 [Epulopiscium sp. Nele67-Bin004]|nr:MAG: hypothetical protein ATN35_12050 [Epulopiscium sp. Nele67-Bin004]
MEVLYNSTNNQSYSVVKTPNIPLLNVLGIFEGSQIFKKNTYKHGGPALVLVGNREVAVGKDIAELIEVKKQEE